MSVMLVPLKSIIGEMKSTSLTSKKARFTTLRNSILRDGVLNPLIVIKYKDRFKVIDGKKRLSILRKLAKCQSFTRSLYKIPCVIETTATKLMVDTHKPILMTDPELAHAVHEDLEKGLSYTHIAQRFDCNLSHVEDIKSLETLSPKLVKCFNDKTLSLSQAAAFATIPNHKAQWDLLLQLGPFLSNKDIIKAIKQGETVLELPDDNVLIIPSRTLPRDVKNSARYMSSQKTAEAYTHRLAA